MFRKALTHNFHFYTLGSEKVIHWFIFVRPSVHTQCFSSHFFSIHSSHPIEIWYGISSRGRTGPYLSLTKFRFASHLLPFSRHGIAGIFSVVRNSQILLSEKKSKMSLLKIKVILQFLSIKPVKHRFLEVKFYRLND